MKSSILIVAILFFGASLSAHAGYRLAAAKCKSESGDGFSVELMQGQSKNKVQLVVIDPPDDLFVYDLAEVIPNAEYFDDMIYSQVYMDLASNTTGSPQRLMLMVRVLPDEVGAFPAMLWDDTSGADPRGLICSEFRIQ